MFWKSFRHGIHVDNHVYPLLAQVEILLIQSEQRDRTTCDVNAEAESFLSLVPNPVQQSNSSAGKLEALSRNDGDMSFSSLV